MSKIEELIQQYCPDGVEYVKLGDVCEFRNGFAFKSNLFQSDGLPIVRITNITEHGVDMEDAKYFHMEDYPKTNISTYAINEGDVLVAMSGATTGKIATYKEKQTAYLNQRTGRFVPSQVLNNRFLFHFLLTQVNQMYLMAGGGAQPNLSSNDLKTKIEIPLPPLPVQEEIVRILDTFTELQARQLQYQYYRDQLFAFDGRNDIKWKKLDEVATEWYRGAGIKKDEVSQEGMPCIRYGEIHTTYDIWFDICVSHTDETQQPTKKYAEYGDVLFAITSEDIPMIGNSVAYLGKDKILVGGDIVVMKHNQNPRYMAYALSTSDAVMQKGKGKVKSKVVHTNVPSLKEIVIPVPTLDEQERIASILDKFNSLVNDISQGLPAEIEARQQQYEYYRDKLLTFKKKA